MKTPRRSLTLALTACGLLASPAMAATTPVIEFFNTTLNHYFITASAAEAAVIDQGGAGPGWVRTGKTFAAYPSAAEASAGAVPVCRFYGTPGKGPNSHFYTAHVSECEGVKQDPGWTYEGLAFYIQVPSGGSCPAGTQAVSRNYNQRWQQNDSNHRYSTDQAIYNQMIAAGWSAEGIVFCAAGGGDTPPPPSNASDCLPAYTQGDMRRFQVSATGVSAAPASPLTESVGASVSFDGQATIPSTWKDDAGNSVQTLYQQFTGTERLELGVDSYNPGSSTRASSIKYAPYLHYPLRMTAGQTANSSFATVDALSGASIANNTLAYTYNGHESVTVPAGTFANACKFTSITQTSAYGLTITNQVTSWVDNRVGLVKSHATTTNFGITTTVTHALISANVGGVVVP